MLPKNQFFIRKRHLYPVCWKQRPWASVVCAAALQPIRTTRTAPSFSEKRFDWEKKRLWPAGRYPSSSFSRTGLNGHPPPAEEKNPAEMDRNKILQETTVVAPANHFPDSSFQQKISLKHLGRIRGRRIVQKSKRTREASPIASTDSRRELIIKTKTFAESFFSD